MKANVIQSESFFYFLFFQIIMSYVVSSFPFVLKFFSVFSLSFVLSVKKSCLGKTKYYYSIKIYSARWLKRIKYIYNVKLYVHGALVNLMLMAKLLGNQVRVLSANCQGLRDKAKRRDVINYFKDLKPSILCLQDTHLTIKEENNLRMLTEFECIISGKYTNSREVAILFNNNFEYKIIHKEIDNDGNYVMVDLDVSSVSLRLINIYAPNMDSPGFFQSILKLIEESQQDHLIVCGDFNLVLNPELDSFNYVNINNPRSRQCVLEMLQLHNMKDAFRYLHPTLKRYSWRRKNPIKQARLDYFIVSESLTDLIADCNIKPGYRSDHSILELDLVVNPFQRGRGLWKLNCSLLKNPEYLNMINHTIQDVLLSYVVPVYNIEFITESNFQGLQFVIADDVLLEMIMFKIREVTIKFSGTLKRKECQVEKNLVQDIEKLESNENTCDFLAIETKKEQLLELQKYRMRRQAVRSRTRWLHSGEKPSNYFCSLEQKNFINKAIKNSSG